MFEKTKNHIDVYINYLEKQKEKAIVESIIWKPNSFGEARSNLGIGVYKFKIEVWKAFREYLGR